MYKHLYKITGFIPFVKNQSKLFKPALFIFFLFIFFIADAQEPGNSNSKRHPGKISADVKEVEKLQKKSLDLSASNIDSAMLLGQLALKLSKQFKNDTCFASAYLCIGWCHYYSGNRDSAEYFLLKAANLSHKLGMTVFEARALVNLSYVYQDGEEYIKLLDCLKRARPVIEKSKDEIVLSTIDLTMGSTYGDMQMYEEGKRCIFSAIAVTKKLNRKDMLPSCYSACGYIFMQEGNFDSALYYYHLNYMISAEMEDPESIAIASDNLGEAFQKKGSRLQCSNCIDSALYYYTLALNGFIQINSAGYIKYAKMNLGGVLRIKKQYRQAEEFLTEAFQYFDSTDDKKYTTYHN